jgi:hypothetical protein
MFQIFNKLTLIECFLLDIHGFRHLIFMVFHVLYTFFRIEMLNVMNYIK